MYYLIFIVVVLILLSLYNWWNGNKGTWSKDNTYIPLNIPKPVKKSSSGGSKGESICRQFLENYFDKPFPNCRPDFLRNPVTGGKHNLELDCFNKELKLAVEYHGAQHYKFIPFFHKSKEAFYNQKYRDELTKRGCKDHGVVLIEVPYTVAHDKIPSYLRSQLQKYER